MADGVQRAHRRPRHRQPHRHASVAEGNRLQVLNDEGTESDLDLLPLERLRENGLRRIVGEAPLALDEERGGRWRLPIGREQRLRGGGWLRAAEDPGAGIQAGLPHERVANGRRRQISDRHRIDQEPEAVGQPDWLLHVAPDPFDLTPEREGTHPLIHLPEFPLQGSLGGTQHFFGDVDAEHGDPTLIPFRVGQRLGVHARVGLEHPSISDVNRHAQGQACARTLVARSTRGAHLGHDRRVVPTLALIVED